MFSHCLGTNFTNSFSTAPTAGPARGAIFTNHWVESMGSTTAPERCDRAWNALDSHIYGHTLQELNFPFDPDAIPEVIAELMPLMASYPNAAIISAAVMASDYGGKPDFDFGLQLLLDGLERLLASYPADDPPADEGAA